GAARAAQRRTEAHLKVLRGLVRLGQERARRGSNEDLRSLGGWFHETLAQASGSTSLTSVLTQLRHKIAWMYTVEAPVSPVESWTEHGAIVDAVARGDAERARALTTLHAERATGAHRLRFSPAGERVRTSQHAVNMSGPRL
ncbi:FCD domain-containing protein, partial [Streptomyces sp. NPDC001356]